MGEQTAIAAVHSQVGTLGRRQPAHKHQENIFFKANLEKNALLYYPTL
jgi:hypothetical protein